MAEMYLPTSQLRELFLTGIMTVDYEALLERRYRRWVRQGDTVVDIGAHRGRHLEPIIDCVGRSGKTFGFEPLPDQFAFLARTFQAPNVQIHNVALFSEPGTSEFTFAQGSPQESGLKERIFKDPEKARPKSIIVDVQTLDQFIDELEGLSFIKIDVEGAEIGCLNGAIGVLKHYRPLVSVEYGQQSYSAYGNTASTLFDFATANGYVLYDLFLNRFGELPAWEAAVDSIYYDFFLVPLEREAEFLSRMEMSTDPFTPKAAVLECGMPVDLFRKRRVPDDFDPEKYLELNPDVRESGMSPTLHYRECGFFEGRPYKN